jgi:hypothetical protein
MICTLAAAHAEAGRFSEAVNAAATARDSATRANDAALASKCSRMLELFQANKPYREAPNASAPAP